MRLRRIAFGAIVATLLGGAAPVAMAASSGASAPAPTSRATTNQCRLPTPKTPDLDVGLHGSHVSAFAKGEEDADEFQPWEGPYALYMDPHDVGRPNGWPVSDRYDSWDGPSVSGTGALRDGVFYWSDWLYDDHGTTTASPGDISVTAGSPSFGTYTYPPGAAHGNGADIWRAAVADRPDATYWRVDWTTLASPEVPIAEWTFDRDNNAATGSSDWPAGAGVHSAGIDTALTMSCHGARLMSIASGKVLAKFPVSVDMWTQSFVVRIPKSVLDPTGSWRIRLAAGLADQSGTGFTRPPNTLPIQPAVYNVTFRRADQEPVADDYWDDMAQTLALATGNVTMFSHVIRWSELAHHVTRAQPLRPGWNDLWYYSFVNLGPGIVTEPSTIADGQPNYLGRIQPYAIYIPTGKRPKDGWPLTFLLHSLTQNQNQYAATTPNFSRQACEDRHSICVTTLGRGPDGNYWKFAELDFWQVWHEVAMRYDLDPDRTILCGYSMGGLGSNQIAMEHPDLFAKVVTLAGAVGNVPTLGNLRWLPTYLAGGVTDELVPLPVEQAEADGLGAMGFRYRWVVYPEVDHVIFELADSFADAAAYMGHAKRVKDPGRFSYTWFPRNSADAFSSKALTGGGIAWTNTWKLEMTTDNAYWAHALEARSQSEYATVDVVDKLRPGRSIHTHMTQGVAVQGPGPGIASEQTWTRGRAPKSKPVIRLRLTNVRSLGLTPPGFFYGSRGVLRVTTDGPTSLEIYGWKAHLSKGSRTIHFKIPPPPAPKLPDGFPECGHCGG